MSDQRLEIAGTTRRRALAAGAGAVGAVGTAAVLAACGTDEPGYDPYVPVDENAVGGTPTPPASPTAPASPPASGGTGDGGEDANALAATDEVPVGGGLILADQDVVITQPTQGQWRGFSATCTHQGCTVAGVDSGTINCNCHGSRFSIEDGSVVNAAAGLTPENQDPLPAKEVDVRDGQVFLA